MTSKISYSKLIKENIRHRGWLAVLSAVLMLLCVTVSAMLMLETTFSNYGQSDLEPVHAFRGTFPAMLNGSSNLLLVALFLLLGGLCAVTGFSYLHSRERTDFYHSLPLSRRQLFFISYLGGLLIFLIPYLTACLLTILAGSVYGFFTASVLGRCCVSILGGILAFLLIYHLTLLAMMLTGKVVTGILAAAAMFIYGSIINALAAALPSHFFSTYCTGTESFLDNVYKFLGPWPLFTQILGSTAYYHVPAQEDIYLSSSSYFLRRLFSPSYTPSLLAALTGTAVFLTVLLFLTLVLYQKRPSEAAENALAFPGTAPFIKVLVSVPTALCIGIMTGSMYYGSSKWIILLSLLAVVLLCGVIEFIYHMDVRRLFAGKYSTLVSFLGVAGILCVLQFDVFGYDTWIPEESSLESMSMELGQIYGYFSYPGDVAYNSYDSWTTGLLYREEGQLTDFGPIYELAGEGVENTADGIARGEEEYVNVTIRYNRKRGKPVYRYYMVSLEQALDTLADLCREESFRQMLFPIFYVDYDAVSEIRLTDIYQEPEVLDLTDAQRDALLDAYKKDILDVDIRDLQYECPIGELSIDLPETVQASGQNVYDAKWNVTVPCFYLYEGYENSLALLKEYGYAIRRRVDPRDVGQIKLTEAVYPQDAPADSKSSLSGTSEFILPDTSERMVTDPDEIEELLPQIQYSTSRLLINPPLSGKSVEILFKGSSDPIYYSLSQS